MKWKEHEVSLINYEHEVNKISLSCFDDKRYVIGNEVETLSYGHKDN